MIHFLPNNTVTERHLQGALEILRDPKRWCKVYLRKGDAYCINGALYAAGMPLFKVPEESMYLTNLTTSGATLNAVRCKSHLGSFALRCACSQTFAMLDCLMMLLRRNIIKL